MAGAEPMAKGALLAGRAADHPSVAALVANPDLVADVPVNKITALLASLASEQAKLTAVQGVLMTRLLASQSAVTDESVDQLLTAEEVARPRVGRPQSLEQVGGGIPRGRARHRSLWPRSPRQARDGRRRAFADR
jgi:hypothetical protein